MLSHVVSVKPGLSTSTTELPQNIVAQIQKFEESKATYLQHQERLGLLAKRLEKHRKAADAAQAESIQLGNQWREEFRHSDGELTKEIRNMKAREIEARELAEEYKNLVTELTPEYELCLLDTYQARNSHLSYLQSLKDSYADYIFNRATEELFSRPEAIPFLVGLNHRFKNVNRYYNTSERFSQISDQDLVDDYAHNNNGKYLISIIQKYLDDVDSGDLLDEGFNQYTEIKPIGGELANQSVAGMVRKRAELKALLDSRSITTKNREKNFHS